MLRLLDEMTENKLIEFDINSKEFFVINNEIPKHESYLCENCHGKTVVLNDLENYKKVLSEIWKNKPEPTLLFDQRPVTLDTSLNRVAYLLTKNDIYNKKIVFLGDDDLTSICLALTNPKCEITVLDADERLIEYIKNVSNKYKLNIIAKVMNVMDKVDEDLLNKYDVLITDPTPEKIPFTLFMNVAIDITKSNAIIYASIYSSAMMKTLDLQRVITNMNLYITDMVPNFTDYKYIYKLYSSNDINKFEKYGVTFDENSICFTETLFRMEKNYVAHKLPLKFTKEQIMGKATKRVLKDEKNEVASKNIFLENARKKMMEDRDKFNKESIVMGHHAISEIYECNAEQLDNIEYIKTVVKESAKAANLTIVEENFHKFSPIGISGVLILSESHLTIHTWPEYKYVAIDCFTCGDKGDPRYACELIAQKLKSKNYIINEIERGMDYELPRIRD